MSLQLNADNLNEFSSAQQQNESGAKTTEENIKTEQNQINFTSPPQQGVNSTFNFPSESKEIEAKLPLEKKDSYDDDMYEFYNNIINLIHL